jgi:AbrB family looped-hinge helix DNA binding protein
VDGNTGHKLDKFISKNSLLLDGEEMAEAVVKVTSKGQLTLPVDIRDELDISEDDYLYVTEAGGLILMKKIGVDPREILNAFQRGAREIGLTRRELDRVIQEIRRAKR